LLESIFDRLRCFLQTSAVVWYQQMQVSIAVFLELQHAHEGDRLPELARQRDAHLSPALPDVPVSTRPLWNPLGVEREGRHAFQFVLCRNLRDPCAHFLEFWIAAPPAPVRLAEKRRVPELSRLTLDRPDRRFVPTSEGFFPFHISRPLQLILNTVK
jgi:hypothetical protein